MRRTIREELSNYPEFVAASAAVAGLRAGSVTGVAAGGFSALGMPSSWHSDTPRRLRRMADAAVRTHDVFGAYRTTHAYLEHIIDRLMLRPEGVCATADMWHRDVAMRADGSRPALDGDHVFGGWINLDDTDQFLSCVPGTHTEPLPTSDADANGFFMLPPSRKRELRERRQRVVVPPGCMLVFNELLIHEVAAKKASHDMYRLFTAWRLSNSSVPLIEDVEERLRVQAVVPLKSRQDRKSVV